MEKINNLFAGAKALVAAVLAFVVFNVVVASCSDGAQEGEYRKTPATYITDTVIEKDTLVQSDTVILDNGWKVSIKINNYGDSISVTTKMENPLGEKHELPGYVLFYPKRNNYEIFADKEFLSPSYANNGMTGGISQRVDETAEGWWDVVTFFFPTEDGNILVVECHLYHIPNLPYVRVTNSSILSLEDPTMKTRGTYKVKDAPVVAENKVKFEAVSFANDSTFTENLTCDFNRYLMAEDDVDRLELVSKGTKPVDPQTVQDSVKVNVVMKSGQKKETVEYNVRKNRFTAREEREMFVNDFSNYHLGSYLGLSSYEAEKKVAERSNESWSVYGKTELASFAEAGEKPFNFEYYLYTERAQYNDSKWGITAAFDYIVPELKNALSAGANNLTITGSDKSGYDKAVAKDNINIVYAGYTTPLSEIVNLYKEVKVERTLKDSGFEKKKKEWTPTALICSAIHYKLWSDGTREETSHEWRVPRSFADGPSFDKVALDNTNRTGKPSINKLDKSEKTYNDENSGKWSGIQEKATIGASLEFNGAEEWTLTWTSSEYNNIKLTVGDDVLDFGSDTYNFTLKPSLGEGSVSSGYTVYPYTGKLNYVFGDAPAKEGTDTGVIKVKLPKTLVRSGFTNKKKVWTSTTLTCSATHFDVYSDSSRVETSHKWEVPRSFENGPAFERIAKDNTNNTGKPSITNLGKAAKSYTDEKGGKWSGIQESATIGASLEFNGAEKWNLTWTASEYNNIKLQVGDDVLDFGSDTYEFTLNPSLGTSSVKDGYNVWPYTGKLSYKFGDAAAKTGTDTGVIKVKKEKQPKKQYFADKDKVFTATTVTFKANYVTEYDDNTTDKLPFELVKNRSLKNGPAFDRIAKDNTNRTSNPTIIDLQSSPKTQKGDKGEEWSYKQDKATIGSSVSFNGAESADVLFYAEEVNDVQLKYKDAVCDFGHDEYTYTLNPALAAGSVKDGFTVYPYTATLNYVFGTAAAKQATDKGTIKVAVPEEKRFFKKEWGDLEYVEQTTTMSKDMKTYSYVWSLHFYNKSNGKRYVLPTILEKDAPHKPLWDFSLVEECDKSHYEKYNSAFYDPRSKSWKNAWAEDAREWLQWSLAEEGTAKKAYGTTVYETAKAKAWDEKSYVSGRPTVFTHRYELTVKDGRLFATDTYDKIKVTDSNCVDGGWK